MEMVKGALYVVGTPIGNLSDMSPRAVETLRNVDFIAAEDTRVTKTLLSRHGIKTRLVSCHEHNISEKGEGIVSLLENGRSCALVTDAGMPCVSDPGEELVRLCAEKGVSVYAVPGACAATAALAVSGLRAARFCFEGFLSVSKKQRAARLSALKYSPYTLIFYEAPHKLKRTLADLLAFLGDRKIAVCREMTKIHEEVIRGSISEIAALYEDRVPKGEYVIVAEGYREVDNHKAFTLEEAAEMALDLKKSGSRLSDAARVVAELTGLKKSEIYRKSILIDKEK
ncbi:MAG: 16S rRNA (cytidine(1402)-2'-O)-methyltransferase [Oscillospiraceae bacterium]|jgi:16S rRNA (cytidine1402-2'-O)-methyltransferase|nr:16S rRNA (cytidine(1402)-2'-O)-methyltransferase [Oscillospiraceae bacterium]